jgi:MFS family permease
MPRALWLLVIGMAVNVTGSSFLWPMNAIYIHDQLGKSLTIAGLVLMLNSAASVVGNLFGGTLFDRIGGYKSVLIGISITVIALFGLTFWHGWPWYVFFLVIVGFGSGIVFPAMYAMAGSVWKEGGRKAFNAIYVAQNLGVAIGSALGGLVAAYSFQLIFLVNAILYLLFLIIAFFGYKDINTYSGKQVSKQIKKNQLSGNIKLNALLTLCVGYLLCWVGYVQWPSTIATYTQELGISLKQYSLIWTINGALIVLGQPLISKVVKHWVKTVKRQIIVGTAIFALSFFILTFAGQFSAFAVAMIIMTIGEMLVWPAVPTIADQLAPKGKEGFYQGIVNSTATGGRMIGPILGGVIVDYYDMRILFFLIMGLFILSIVTTMNYDRKLKEQNELHIKTS